LHQTHVQILLILVHNQLHCSIEYLANGCIEYTPLPGLTITDEVTIFGTDALGNTDVATAFVDIGCDGNLVAPNNNPNFNIDKIQENISEPFKVTNSQMFGNVIAVDFENDTDEMIEYSFINLEGKVLKQNSIEAVEGYNRFHIEDINVVTGLYIIVLNDGKDVITKKMLVE